MSAFKVGAFATLLFCVSCEDFTQLQNCARLSDGGVVDAAACDGGSTAGGSAAGGSTAGGSTAGGSTAGGSTAGGSTAGGSTAGGSTAGGSTAGGSTAGGSTAGGSTAGGSTAGGSTAGGRCGGFDVDAGRAFGPWDGGIEVVQLVAGWTTAESITPGSRARGGLLARLDGRRDVVAHFPRHTESSGVVRAGGHLLELSTGSYCGPQVQLGDVVSLSSNRGVLGVVEWYRLDSVASDGGDRVARYLDEGTFAARFPNGNAGGAVAATAFQSNGAFSPLEVGNDMGGGYSLHPTGGRSQLSCAPRDNGGAPIRRVRPSGEDLFAFLSDCGGGLSLLVSTHDTHVRGPNIPDAGQIVFDVGFNSTRPVVAVMRPGTPSELEVTRYESDAGVSRTRRFQFVPQVTVRSISIDDFDQPVLVLLGASSLTVSSGDAGASLNSSSTLSLLHLDTNLNPVRFAGVGYPVPLASRSLLAIGNSLVIDVECFSYDGGTAWPCPSNKSSFAMGLVLEDGGTP